MSPDQELESWIASRKEEPAVFLAQSVMKEILAEESASSHQRPESKYPSWLISTTCLLAGIGKLGLVIHLAF